MSLRLLVDECMQSNFFLAALTKAGHDVQSVSDANLSGQADETIFAYAIQKERIIITYNCIDFDTLAKSHTKGHPGVLLVYLYNNPQRDMSNNQIIAAITNLEATEMNLENKVIALNSYNY